MRDRPATGSVGVLYRQPAGVGNAQRYQLAGRALLGAEVREEDQSAALAWRAGWWLVVLVGTWWQRVPAAR